MLSEAGSQKPETRGQKPEGNLGSDRPQFSLNLEGRQPKSEVRN